MNITTYPSLLLNFSLAFQIIQTVCKNCGVTPDQLESKDRHWAIVWPRWLCIYLIRQHTKLTLEAIGLLFDRDHSVILHALHGLESQIATDPRAKAQFTYLSSLVTQSIDLAAA